MQTRQSTHEATGRWLAAIPFALTCALVPAITLVPPPATAGNIYFQTTGSAVRSQVASVLHNNASRAVGEPHQRKIVRDASGLWYVVWMDLDGPDGAGSTGFYEIRMSRSLNTAGTGWSASMELAGDTGIIYTDATHGFYHPTIDIDRGSGILHIVFQRLEGPPPDPDTDDDQVVYSKCSDLANCNLAGSWYQLDGLTNGFDTPVTDSNCHEPHAGYSPSLAIDSNGGAHIGYATGNQRWPWYIHGSVGSGWGTSIQMDATDRNHRFPTVEVDSNDIVHFAWNEVNTAGIWYENVYHRSAAGPAYTAFSGTTTLISDTGTHFDWLSMAADDEGNVHLSCFNRTPQLLAGAYFNGATWTEINPLSPAGWDRPQVSAHLGVGVTDDVILSGTTGADPDDLYTFTWNGAAWGAVPTDAQAETDTGLAIEKRAPVGSIEYGFIYFDAVASTNYRSIGTASDYTTGSVSATAGSATVTGTGTAWRSANRGRGDRITINGTHYVVNQVFSDTSLALTTPASTTYSGSSYTIARQFTMLSAWEDCVDGPGGTPCPYFPVASSDLVTDDRNEVGIAYKDSVFTTGVVIDGSTTDAQHFITLTVADGNRHTGRAGTGAYLDRGSGPAGLFMGVEIRDDFTRVEGLEIRGYFYDGIAGGATAAFVAGTTGVVLDGLLIHGFDDGDPVLANYGIRGSNASTTTNLQIRNCFIFAGDDAGIQQNQASSDLTVENCSIHGMTRYGVWNQSGTMTATNVIAMDNPTADFFGTMTQTTNLSSDATGTVPLTNRVAANQFVSVSAGAVDLHLKPGADALEQGTDLSVSFSHDIDQELRPSGASWDIGADEAVASFTCPTGYAAWFDTTWSYRKAILLNSTLVAGPISNFPALVVLDNDAEIQTPTTQANFNDIVFTAADGITKLPHEIEAYDSGQGDLTAWVKVPYVSNGSDTIIYIYYGNPTSTDQRDPTNVWDPGYVGVWHIAESGNGSSDEFRDSTANGNHGQGGAGTPAFVPMQAAGKVASGQEFDGTDDFIDAGNDGSLTMSTQAVTLEAWFQIQEVISAGFGAGIAEKGDSYKLYQDWDANRRVTFTADSVVVQDFVSMTGLTLNQWYHAVGTYDGSNVRLYIDGTQADFGAASGNIAGDVENFTIGTDLPFDGPIDEVRVSNVVRTPEWIQTEYNNQFDPIADPVGFCKVCAATTEVSLESFEASGLDGEVRLAWRTASELDNLGFHLYRAPTEGGPYERITERVIPGLMSSAVGAGYSYSDTGVTNGTTYFYQLEDIESSGRTMRHGPVDATPRRGVRPEPSDDGILEEEEGDEATKARITYGEPSKNGFEILSRTANSATLRLSTAGFYAEPLEDGTVRISIPGLNEVAGESSLPVKRSWLDAVRGLNVELASVEATQLEFIDGLVPAGSAVDEMVASRNGTVRRRRRRLPRVSRERGPVPGESARLVSVGFQGDTKKALIELAPLRWDAASGRLRLAKHVEVRVLFRGRDASEVRSGRRYRGGRSVLARLVTHERGLYAARFEDVVGKGRALPTRSLRLSRQGEAVAYHIEPDPSRFGPGSTLYFLSEGESVNRYGTEAVYELERAEGVSMAASAEPPTGGPSLFFWKELTREENRFYQAGLVHAPDVWLWDLVMTQQSKSYPFEVDALAPVNERSHLTVWLQGTSDEPAPLDHHIRAFVNGSFVGELRWDGKQTVALEAELPPGVLVLGENLLELQNVGDTGSDYSMVMLDRFLVRYPRPLTFEGRGTLEGLWSVSGVAEIPEAYVMDVTKPAPRWLGKTARFRAAAGHRYLATSEDALLRPEIERVVSSGLRSTRNQADYLVIGSRELLQVAEPLLAHRRSQGLGVVSVQIEELFSEFGFGEQTPEAIRDFIAYAYHEWRDPSPRYVLLLGDATYDFKDYLQTGVVNQVPPRMVKTTYLWTASDPSYAAVHGDDVLPDLAMGRLPAADANELRVMIDKILAYETEAVRRDAPVVFVADNGDAAGQFERDADELAATVLAGRDPQRIYLSQLGTTAARGEILDAFDHGASLMSYIGHGAIHLWADENLFNTGAIESLTAQSQQPLLLTMNCLNGYFHFPYFDSLAEGLVKAESKGAIAAFSPSGLSLNAPAKRYHEALLREIVSSRHERLGDAVLAAQQAYAATGSLPELLTIYHLFGDPALTIGFESSYP